MSEAKKNTRQSAVSNKKPTCEVFRANLSVLTQEEIEHPSFQRHLITISNDTTCPKSIRELAQKHIKERP